MHGPGQRLFERGGLKFAILAHLKDKPRHGYDIIREMEEQSGGFYSPSPGAVYPTLQALEDQDLVTSATEDGKKVYTITEVGLAYLEEHKERAECHRERWEAHWGPGPEGESLGLVNDIRDALGDVKRAVRRSAGDSSKLKEIGAVLQEAAGKILAIAKR
jgi:DNA-binding PadR family transcriptional regulator